MKRPENAPKYKILAFNAALCAAIEYYTGWKGNNKHSFSSECINMRRFIKLYTHNDTGHNIRKATENNAIQK